MNHEDAWERLPDLLTENDLELLGHVRECHRCQRRLFRLQRVHSLLRAAPQRRRRRALIGIAAAIAAAVLLVSLSLRREAPRASTYSLAVGPGGLVTATLQHSGGMNDRVDVKARGLPRPDSVYLLWGRSHEGRKELLGRFMVDGRGSCRVHFSVPRGGWTDFKITAAAQ